MNKENEQKAFEAWYAKRHPKPVHENPTWAHASKMDDWEVWQARASFAPPAPAAQPEQQPVAITTLLRELRSIATSNRRGVGKRIVDIIALLDKFHAKHLHSQDAFGRFRTNKYSD